MSASRPLESQEKAIPVPVRTIFRGIGQVFFQENAITGILFAVGIALSAPIMAMGGIVGSAIGCGVAWCLKYDKSEVDAGIYGFNATLVGVATFFFFQLGAISIALMIGGCIAATLLTRAMRGYLPFPTYTTPFIVATWCLIYLGQSLQLAPSSPSEYPHLVPTIASGFFVESVAHGVGQVMFQASLWTGLLFLIGIALNDRQHAAWVLIGSVLGMIVASYHIDAGMRALDPEKLIVRNQFENIQLGLYGYNATLAAVALFLWRRSLLLSVVGIILTVPLTEFVPMLGISALTAPFVLATWIVMILVWLDETLLSDRSAPASS